MFGQTNIPDWLGSPYLDHTYSNPDEIHHGWLDPEFELNSTADMGPGSDAVDITVATSNVWGGIGAKY